MGTRSLTFVYEEYKDGPVPILCLYRQFDGYPEGHGAELAEFLSGFEIVNGFGQKREKLANGMGCLAAQMVAHFKTEVGQFYIQAPIPGRDDGQDYEYHVYRDRIVVKNYSGKEMFDSNWADFEKFCSSEEVA
jgi:hypothetical protein